MSLRTRLLIGVGAVVVMLAVVAIALVQTTQHRLVRQLDDQLERVAGGPGDVRPRNFDQPDDDGLRPRRPGIAPGSVYVGIVRADGTELVDRSLPDTTHEDATRPALTVDEIRGRADAGPFTVQATEGTLRYRTSVRSIRLRTGNDVLAVYALPMEDADSTVEELIRMEIIASLVIMSALGLVTFWVLRLGVRPLKQMAETASAIGEGDLSRRIPESPPGTEAGDLGVALNKMLGRIEESFDDRVRSEERLRQFVADASHELRTPVTTIRGYAELYRHGGLPNDEAVGEAMRRTEDESIRMGSLVEDLLHLARLDEKRPLELGSVDLSSVLADSAADAQAVEPERPITVEVTDAVSLIGDDAHLRQVVANLLANVRVHTPPSSPVTLRLRRSGDDAVVEVSDRGPGMSTDEADRAFERFYRVDAARSRHTGGSGLGLSIVSAVCDAHGGRAEIESRSGDGTTVRLVLPISGPNDGSRSTPNAH